MVEYTSYLLRKKTSSVTMLSLLIILLVPAGSYGFPQLLRNPTSNDFGIFSKGAMKNYQNSFYGRSESSPAEIETPSSENSNLYASASSVSVVASSSTEEGKITDEIPVSPIMTGAASVSDAGTVESTVQPKSSTTDNTTSLFNITEFVNSTTVDNTTNSEKVVTPARGDSTISSYSKIFQHTLVWLNDTYILSILIPVCGGFVFASVIIVVVATCRCMRRRCFRRRLRSKVLPESIKGMRKSDRTRLLAESSDEEF